MRNYEVRMYFSEICKVKANNEAEAQNIAYNLYKSGFVALIPDEYEVECLEEDEE